MIPVYKPFLNKKILSYAHEALESTWISSSGKYLNIVSDKLKELNNSNYVILTNNGTSATHLMSIGLKYKNPTIKNIIVPNNVYIAAWNSFKMNPVYNLIPLDCDLDTWNTNYDNIWQYLECDERTNKKDYIPHLDKIAKYNSNDTAFLIVHNIGNIVDVPKLKNKYENYIFLEDNCEGFLGKYGEKPSGSESLMSSVSFFGNKTLTSGEGGAIFTNDEDLYHHLNSVKSHGMTENKFVFNKLGYNYRMSNVQAAILLGQIESIDIIKEKKSFVFDEYKKNLGVVEGLVTQKIETNTTHSEWVFGLRFTKYSYDELKNLQLHLYKNDIETRPMFPPITHHSHYKGICDNIKNAKILYEQILILPSYPDLTKEEIKYICNTIKKYEKSFNNRN